MRDRDDEQSLTVRIRGDPLTHPAAAAIIVVVVVIRTATARHAAHPVIVSC